MTQPRTPDQIYQAIMEHEAQMSDQDRWTNASPPARAQMHATHADLVAELADAATSAPNTPLWACWAVGTAAATATARADWWQRAAGRQLEATDGAEAQL